MDSSGISKFHTNANITCDEFFKLWIKCFSLMLAITLCCRGPRELCHVNFTYLKALLLNCVDNFTHIGVRVWLDHCEGAFSLSGLFLSSSYVSVFFDHNDSAENGSFRANEQFR